MIKRISIITAALLTVLLAANGYSQIRRINNTSGGSNTIRRMSAPEQNRSTVTNKSETVKVPEVRDIKVAGRNYSESEVDKIIVYHTGDIHGFFDQHEEYGMNGKKVGGYAVLKTAVKKEKYPVVLLDTGDVFQGTPEGNFDNGRFSMEIMNLMGYKAMALGNHEFDFGLENVFRLEKMANFPFLSANTYMSGSRAFKAYTVIEVGNYKIALIGLAALNTKTSTMPAAVAKLTFKNLSVETKAVLKEIKENVNAVMVLSHDGLSKERFKPDIQPQENINLSARDIAEANVAIARANPGQLAVIMGGHIHNGLLNGYYDKQSDTLFTESKAAFGYASRIELVFDKESKQLVDKSVRLVLLDPAVFPPDPQIQKALDKVSKEVGKELDVVIAKSKHAVPRKDCVYDNSMGNLITDVFRKHAGTDFAFQNSMGTRADFKAGNITKRDVYMVFPFDNKLVTLNLKGSDVLAVMKSSVWKDAAALQASGMTVNFSLNAAGKSEDVEVLVNGAPIDPSKNYSIALPDFVAEGGSGGAIFKQRGTNIKVHDTLLRDVFGKGLADMKTIGDYQPCGYRFILR